MNAPVLNLMDQSRGAAHDDLLKSSIRNFLAECPKSVSNLSSLVSLYRGLIEKLKDPPLDVVLFYGAIVFHAYKLSSLPPPGILLVAQDLLELVNESSSLFNALRKVAVIAPVVYLLYHLELNFSAGDPSLREEIGITVEGMVNYISICCSQYTEGGGQESEHLGGYIMDLIRIWMVDPAKDCDKINSWESCFPTLDNDSQPEVTVYLGYLAGVVMNETLLLRLLLKISPAIDREDLQKNMLNVAIQTIKGFQNFYFLDSYHFFRFSVWKWKHLDRDGVSFKIWRFTIFLVLGALIFYFLITSLKSQCNSLTYLSFKIWRFTMF